MQSNKNGRVSCKNCNNNVTPRLWHHEGGVIIKREIEHICPICGETMYSTGGGVTLIGLVFGMMILAYALYAVSMLICGYLGLEKESATFISFVIVSLLFINFLLKKLVGHSLLTLFKKWRR
ncbi:hypothetical protein [Marinobacterium stanieri]|uniref:hypothetical protein n=1 Tax=Marinobacterium stanieri TaxID=49186 RepID=UPI003A92B9F2